MSLKVLSLNGLSLSGLSLHSVRRMFCLAVSASLLFGCGSSDVNDQDADPIAETFPIAYIKRPLPVDDDGERVSDDLTELLNFQPGAALYFRSSASPGGSEQNITARAFEEDAL